MKRYKNYAIASVLLLAGISCQKSIENELPNTLNIEYELIPLTITATIGESDETKTAVPPDGTSIFWTPGDAINLVLRHVKFRTVHIRY